jgi:hypothetical protein
MRIQEERERRERQANNLARLPGALQQIHDHLAECTQSYTEKLHRKFRRRFGGHRAAARPDLGATVWEERDGNWQALSQVDVVSVPDMPGFRMERGEYSLAVEAGLLPGDKLSYRDREQDSPTGL